MFYYSAAVIIALALAFSVLFGCALAGVQRIMRNLDPDRKRKDEGNAGG